jgi:N-dimethylarginine dimethylaminohydrolase
MDRNKQVYGATFGGDGWFPRQKPLRDEIGKIWAACGLTAEWTPLKAVLLHRPGSELKQSADPDAVQMLQPLNLDKARQQHDDLASAFTEMGVTIHYLDAPACFNPNQMFMADLFFMTPEGAILARPASTVRAGEEREVARKLAELGIPILRTISGRGTFEGADALWLDAKSVLVGRGLRTNNEGAAQVAAVLREMDVETIVVDLPYGTMHLMGMLRFADKDLALAWPKRLAHHAVEVLKERGYQVAFIPDEMEANRGYALNYVTLGPREILMPDGNPVTQEFFELLGISCCTVAVDELAKAAGAIGCLTGILEREPA